MSFDLKLIIYRWLQKVKGKIKIKGIPCWGPPLPAGRPGAERPKGLCLVVGKGFAAPVPPFAGEVKRFPDEPGVRPLTW